MSFRQVAVSLISSSTLLTSGMHIGYSAVAVPQLEGTEDYLTKEERSWFASIGTIATILGCLMCGPLLDKLGRKWTLLSVNVPFIIGWIIIWVAPKPASAPLLYVGRLLTGLGGGMVSIPANVYIAEMSTKAMRSMLVAWPSIAVTTGILLVYLFGWIIQDNFRLVAAACLICPILTSILVFFTLKESPTWLAAKGRISEAEESLRWVRNLQYEDEMPGDVNEEYQAILQNAETRTRGDPEGNNTEYPEENGCAFTARLVGFAALKQTLKRLSGPDTWKPLLILNSYFFFMQFAGVNVLTSYTVNIMIGAGIDIDPYLGTVLIGVVQLIFGASATLVLNRYGRRPMSIISGVGMTASTVLLGVYMQIAQEPQSSLSWIPLVLLLAYTITGSIGIRLIPWALIGEVYPTTVRGLAGGITTCFAYFFGFIVVKFYPDLVTLLGGERPAEESDQIDTTPGVFYLFGFMSFLAIFFVYFFLPETLGRSLEEIRQGFLPKNERQRIEVNLGRVYGKEKNGTSN